MTSKSIQILANAKLVEESGCIYAETYSSANLLEFRSLLVDVDLDLEVFTMVMYAECSKKSSDTATDDGYSEGLLSRSHDAVLAGQVYNIQDKEVTSDVRCHYTIIRHV